MRCFLALDPAPPLRHALSALQDRLRAGRHVDEDDLHLTLAFMEDAGDDVLDDLNLSLELMRPGPVRLEVSGLDTFGSEHPRLVYAAVRAHSELVQLQRKVETCVRRAGYDFPRRRFVPHVTLARFAHRSSPEDLAHLGRFLEANADFRFDPVVTAEVTLYRSVLTEAGPRYDELARYPLS